MEENKDSPIAEIITHNKDELNIIPTEWNELVVNDEDANKSKLIKAIESHTAVSSWGSLDEYLAHNLLKVIEEAMIADNKGEEHIDYRTRLRGIETIIKLTDKNFNNNWVNINFFASPKTLKH